MLDKLFNEGRIPLEVAAQFTEELRKQAELHPMDIATGALIGGAWAGHQAAQRHEKMPSGESRLSNKLRHISDHHTETRQNPKKPSWREKIKERLIAGQLSYARLAQENKNPAIAFEALGGAITGGIGGHTVGKAIRESKAMSLLSKAGAMKVADVVGLRRELLTKKAEYQDISLEEAANQELAALALSKKAELTEDEVGFMEHMRRVQDVVTGAPPEPIKRASMNLAIHRALQKQSSMGELLLQKQMTGSMDKDIPPALVESAGDNIEPSDYRTPAREERRAELLGIFGGPSK